MSVFLRKHFWLLHLAVITLCALFGARAVGRLVEAGIAAQPPARRSAVPPPMMEPTLMSSSTRDITQLLERNIFCSTCEKVTETPVNGVADGEGPSSNEPVRSSLNLKLIATLVSDEDKAWSFAAILDGSDSNTRLYAIGAKVPGEAVLSDVMDRRVLLLNGNRNEYLELDTGESSGGGPSAVPPPSESPVAARPRGLSSMEEEVGKSIRKVGEGRFEIERAALNKVLANTTILARSARIVPSVRDGQPNGFKLYAIRPGSLYSMLGMLNGDTINAVNGHAITTPDKALEVYTKLRNASHLSISFSRGGKPTTHEYNIR